MNKKVSVIIPNYNYARFLQRRIDCIVNQTIKPAEIIFLDDCSTDNSLEVAQEILSKTDIPYRIVPNETNQGVFKQWLKGIELTQYDYFWIAEADDYCELNFLEILLPAFEDEALILSYCKSKLVNESGAFLGYNYGELDTVFGENYFDCSRLLEYNSFVTQHLAVMNVIPNVSAVLLSREKIISNLKLFDIGNYKYCGDWIFYLLLNKIENIKMCYINVPLNYYVRQFNSVFSNSNRIKKKIYYLEEINIYSCLLNEYEIDKSFIESICLILLRQNIEYDGCAHEEFIKFVIENCLFSIVFILYQQEIYKYKKILGVNERFLDERYETIKSMEQMVIERDKSINSMEQMIIERDNSMKSMKQMIIERDNSMKSMEQMVIERDNSMKSMEQMVIERDNSMKSMEQMIIERDNSMKSMEQMIIELGSLNYLIKRKAKSILKKIFKSKGEVN